jgi:hypothetical protein
MLTYGLSRSPTRAHFQNIPNSLSQRVSHFVPCYSHLRDHPETRVVPILVPVHDTRHNRVRISARANDEQDHQEQ